MSHTVRTKHQLRDYCQKTPKALLIAAADKLGIPLTDTDQRSIVDSMMVFCKAHPRKHGVLTPSMIQATVSYIRKEQK